MSEQEKKALEDIKNIVTDLEDAEDGAIIALQQDEIDSLKIIAELIEQQQKEIEELKKDNENQWRHRCKMTIELDYNVVSKDKIRKILKQYEKKDIGYAVDFYKEIEQLLGE